MIFCLIKVNFFINILFQKCIDTINHGDGIINLLIAPLYIGANIDKIFRFLMRCKNIDDFTRQLPLFFVHNVNHHSADTMKHIDSRIMIFTGQIAVQYDMAIKDGSCCICNGFIKIVAFHQNGIKPRDAAPSSMIPDRSSNFGKRLNTEGV